MKNVVKKILSSFIVRFLKNYHYALFKKYPETTHNHRKLLLSSRLMLYQKIVRFMDNHLKKDKIILIYLVEAFDYVLNGSLVFQLIAKKHNYRFVFVYDDRTLENKAESIQPLLNRFCPGLNYQAIHMSDPQHLLLLLRTSIIVRFAYPLDILWYYLYNINSQLRKTLILWHGIPLKVIEYINEFETPETRFWRYTYFGPPYPVYLISSSQVDRWVMSASFYPIDPKNVWITGLPRNDYLVDDHLYFQTFKQEDAKITDLLQGKKMILYLPTFEHQAYLKFNPEQQKRLTNLLKNEYIIVFKTHIHDKNHYTSSCPLMVDWLDQKLPTQALLKRAEFLITDYSSVFFDFLLLKRLILFYQESLDSYPRTLNYDLDSILPAPYISRTPDQFIDQLTILVNYSEQEKKQAFEKDFSKLYKLIHYKQKDFSQNVYDQMVKNSLL